MAFDYKTAGSLCTGTKVSEDLVRAFVQSAINNHERLLGVDANLSTLEYELYCRNAEIALLKEQLLAAEKTTEDLQAEWSLHIQQNF